MIAAQKVQEPVRKSVRPVAQSYPQPAQLSAPQLAPNQVQVTPSKSRLEKVFDVISVSFGLALFVVIILYALLDGREPFTKEILRLGHKYILECLPMYWILMVEDCFQLAWRRSKAWTKNVFRWGLN